MKLAPMVRDFMTGITVLVGVVGTVIMLVLFGELTGVTQRNYRFNVDVTNAGGIAETSPVTVNGVKVGQVEKVGILDAPAIGARLTIRVREGVTIPRTSKVLIDRSLLGDASLEFSVPPEISQAQREDVIIAGQTVAAGSPETLVTQITNMVKEPIEQFNKTAASINTLAGTYNALGERLTELLEPRTLADVNAGKAPNIRTTIERVDLALKGAQGWLGDEALRTQAKALVTRAQGLMDEASTLATTWNKAGATVDTTAKNAGDAVTRLADEAVGTLRATEAAAANLAQTLEKANSGNGTVGQLMNNPDLYNSLSAAAERLDRTLAELQLLVEKYRTEGLPLRLN